MELETYEVEYRFKDASGMDPAPQPAGKNHFTHCSETNALISTPGDETREAGSSPVNISCWRNPSVDIIFAYAKGRLAWSASRKPVEVTSASEEICDRICRTWTVKASQGWQAAEGQVQVRRLVGRPNPPIGGAETDEVSEPAGLEVGLFGLFHVAGGDQQPNGEDLYDVLTWAENAKCFNSIFGIRSVNLWPGPTDSPGDDCIFATFNCGFVLPATRITAPSRTGRIVPRNLARLLPHERSLLNFLRSEEDPDSDPDTGVWVADPG